MPKTYHIEGTILAKHYVSVHVEQEEGEDEQTTLNRAESLMGDLIIRGEDDEAEPEVHEVELEKWTFSEDGEDEDEEQAEEDTGSATEG